MTDQRKASSADGRRGLTGGMLPAAPVVGDSRQWEETTNAGRKRAAAPRGGDTRRRQAGGGGGRRAAAAAVQSTTTERRPRVKLPTTGGIRTTEDDGRPNFLAAGRGKMDRRKAIPWRIPWHEQGHALARARPRLGMSKAAPWHGQGIPWQGLTNIDLGVGPGDVVSPRGGIGAVARRTFEHALGTMPRQDPWTDHGAGHPEPVGLRRTEPRLAPEAPGRTQAPQSCPCPVEKHGPRPLRSGETESRQFRAVG
ncbi:hypothetical protein Scep_012647 [Stephania cephalantha]|uniref:Uncharacterized protein n=1 Tax=Stephania cephalantha TaxID=152367 RepID=A0AAP0P7R1_9MAGN